MRSSAFPAALLLLAALSGCHPAADSSAAGRFTPVTTAPPDRSTGRTGSSVERSARALVAARASHLYSWAADARGDVLGIWSSGAGQFPRQAFAVRTATGRVRVGRAPSASSVQGTLTHGWIVSTTDRQGTRLYRVGLAAVARPVSVSRATVRPRGGDVLVHRGARILVYRPSTRRAYAVPRSPVPHPVGGYVTSSGRLVLVGSTARSPVWETFDHRRWTRGTWPLGQSAGVVGGAGDHVVVVLGRTLGNGVDATGVAGLAISHDGGRTWHLENAPPRVVEALSAVVTRSGTAFVSTGSGQLLRARPGREVRVMAGIRPVSLSSAGHRLYALTTSDRRFIDPVLRVSTDQGRTWSLLAAPGRTR